eukprot:2927396-Ditylum_brightwellii.AAC.1
MQGTSNRAIQLYLHKGSELGGTKIVLKGALLPAVIAVTCDGTHFAIKTGSTAFEEAEKYLCHDIFFSNLEDSIQTKDQEISAFELQTLSTEKQKQDWDTQVTQLKEENAFRWHTILDLKNQLYQLQSNIEEAEYDKQDKIQKWEEK